jgi:hypothetical protein
MKKMIIAATLVASVAAMATAAMAHRSIQPAPSTPDFAKTFWEQQQKNVR